MTYPVLSHLKVVLCQDLICHLSLALTLDAENMGLKFIAQNDVLS